ncbi:MAG: zinc ABC transporter substrate-binding protein [Gemmataceae bacterium]|nr:zinc ABC transporter substrate-binding protein [Gemmataceae bacterium]
MRHLLRATLLFVAVGCAASPDPWGGATNTKVLAYFPPLYSLAATVAGDDAKVMSLIKQVGPHHFDPTAHDARALARADMFLTVGLGLDDIVAKKLTSAVGNSKLKTVALGERLPKESLREGACEHCKRAGKDHAHEHNHGEVEYDPHVWLGPGEAAQFATMIGTELAAADPAHAAGYKARAAALVDRLTKLQDDGRKQLAAKSEKAKLISFHDSLHYFARGFGAEVVDSIEAPGQEPSPKKIAALVDACKKSGARLIAVEPQYSTHSGARVLLDELKRAGINAAFVEIDPMETADSTDLTADWYERKMKTNLANLAAALK